MGKLALMRSQRYAHAKQFRRHRREVKFLRTRLGRVIRDIDRTTAGDASLEGALRNELALARAYATSSGFRSGRRSTRCTAPRWNASAKASRTNLMSLTARSRWPHQRARAGWPVRDLYRCPARQPLTTATR